MDGPASPRKTSFVRLLRDWRGYRQQSDGRDLLHAGKVDFEFWRNDMLYFELLRVKGILIVTPHGPLEKADFERVAKEVDCKGGTAPCGLFSLSR